MRSKRPVRTPSDDFRTQKCVLRRLKFGRWPKTGPVELPLYDATPEKWTGRPVPLINFSKISKVTFELFKSIFGFFGSIHPKLPLSSFIFRNLSSEVVTSQIEILRWQCFTCIKLPVFNSCLKIYTNGSTQNINTRVTFDFWDFTEI